MKYLKPYNESKNYNEISDTLKDICIDLEDVGFTINLFEDINSNDYPQFSVRIFKDGLYFYKDIKEVVERMIKYMDRFNYEFCIGRTRYTSYDTLKQNTSIPHDDDYIRYHFKIVFDEKENKFNELLDWKEIPEKGVPYRKLKVNKGDSYGQLEYNCEFRCELGKGYAVLTDTKVVDAYDRNGEVNIELKDNEMYLGGIKVEPIGKKIGQLFLKELFDYFKVDKFYLSSYNHPYWPKIATDTGLRTSGGCTLYTITRDQLRESLVIESKEEKETKKNKIIKRYSQFKASSNKQLTWKPNFNQMTPAPAPDISIGPLK